MSSNLTKEQARAHAIALAKVGDESSGSMLVELVCELAARGEGAPEVFGISGRTFWGEGSDGDEVRAIAIAVVRAAVLLIADEPSASRLTRLDLAALRLARSCLSSATATAVDRADCAELLGELLARAEDKPTLPHDWSSSTPNTGKRS